LSTAIVSEISAAHEEAAGPVSTGVPGFDAVSAGGLPRGRITAIFGAAGAGKTVFALQTLLHRMRDFDEHTIFVTFEQPVEHVNADVAGFDWGFAAIAETHLSLLDAGIRPGTIHNGRFGLEALTASLSALVAVTGAATVVLDGIDALLSVLDSESDERGELGRLIGWLRESGVTGIITAKSSDGRARSAGRAEFLEYHTDCVIKLDHSETDSVISRTLRIVKYRGSGFNSDLLPVVMTQSGIRVVGGSTFEAEPVSPAEIDTTRYSTGLAELDILLEGGYRRGSTTLISGAPGTAKSTLSTAFLLACAQAGRRSVYVSFDETERQISSHMASVGFLVRPQVEAGLLKIVPMQAHGLPPEVHVSRIIDLVTSFDASVVVIDPISAVMRKQHPFAAGIIEYLLTELRHRGVTMLCTSLLEGSATGVSESTQTQISTLADTWLHLSYIATGGERNRALTIVKSRGTAHSNQIREVLLSNSGVTLQDVYTADGEVLLGNARLQKEATDRRNLRAADLAHEAQGLQAERELDSLSTQLDELQRELERKRRELLLLNEARSVMVEAQASDMRERVEARTMLHEHIDGVAKALLSESPEGGIVATGRPTAKR
jgi:circadian clock protein KaiC